jgi:hypothetical protein
MTTMTNSQKTTLIQQHSEPNHDRIRDLRAEGYSQQEAEEIDSLERREAVLNELGAAGELTDSQRKELDTVQSELLELVGSPHQTYAGTTFAGDGAPAEAELDVQDETADEDEDTMSVEDVTEAQAERRTQMRHAVAFLTRYHRTGNDAALRIAIRHAQKATELEDRIDRALMDAARRETTPAP